MNSQQWWNKIKLEPALFTDWLRDQYHGEATAAARLVVFKNQFSNSIVADKLISIIAAQEAVHAEWIKGLLESRGIKPEILKKEERYWKETLEGIDSLKSGCAVAAHAEEMRLERIRVIVSDETAPEDIREVFSKILKQEVFHAKAFKVLAGKEEYLKASGNHRKGLAALGLTL